MISTRRFLLLVSLSSFIAGTTSAQVKTGTPPFGSFGGGPADVINLSNLNTNFPIPVIHKAGRGVPFNYDLTYDSSVWRPVGVSGNQNWQPVYNWGWVAQTAVATGYLTKSLVTSGNCVILGSITGGWATFNNWVYHDPWGTAHSYTAQNKAYWGAGPGCVAVPFTETANNGSGFTLTTNNLIILGTHSGIVKDRDGEIITVPTASGGSNKDRNGNYVSVDSTGHFTDTLGTQVLTVAGTAPNPVTFTYTAPSGANATFTMSYALYTVKTNFQCSGVAEYGPTANVPLVDRITLPDGTFYQFTYEPTPGFAGNVTGRVASITLPTGGTISYAYTGGNNGITCANGSAAGLTRTTPDGLWTYSRAQVSGSHWTTTVTDPTTPTANQTVFHFQDIYETQREVYQGSSTSGTLLQTVITCYNGNLTNCTTTAVGFPITRRTQTIQYGSNGKMSKRDYFYDNYGSQTKVDDYDYGTSTSPGPLIRKTLTTYASLGNNIVDRPASITVQDGGGITKAQTTFTYDETAPTATSGTPQWVAVSGSRGNATTIKHLVQGTTFLTRTISYFDTGNEKTVTDVNGAQTTYNYSSAASSCGNSFPTSVSFPLTLSRSLTWSCIGSALTQVTNENGRITTVAYTDSNFWRQSSITDPSNAVMNFAYSGATSMEASLTFNSNNSTVDVLSTLDNLGRNRLRQRRQAPGSSSFDSVQTDYDSVGRPSRFTLPFVQAAGQPNPSAPAVTTAYDALGRVSTVSDAGGGSTTYIYAQNDVLVTALPAPVNENTKRRQLEYDSLGRLTSVCEITSLPGSGACGQTVAQTGFWTRYTYDALGNLTGVTQNAQPGGAVQTRSYAYDGLRRRTSETNPETGTTNYIYDTDSTCVITSSGDLVKRVDAQGNVTCRNYDALHRLTNVTYSGPYATSTPRSYFVYDGATINTTPSPTIMANAKTRLAEAYTCFSPCTTKVTDLGFSYTARGEVSDLYQSTPNSAGYYHMNEQYWENGAPKQLNGLPGLPTFTTTVDGEGRWNAVNASVGQNPVTSTSYGLLSSPPQLTVNFGSGDSEVFTFDSNTGRPTQYQFKVGAQQIVGTLTWNSNGTLQSLAITDPLNSPDNQTCTYTHDDLARLASANCGSAWSQTFGYDAFGNITKSGSMSFQPFYSSATNRMTSFPGGFTPTYDSNGNVTNDGSHAYTWDAEGRPVTIDGIGLTYDALGRTVEQNRSGAFTQLVYSPTGAKLALFSGQTLQKAMLPLPGGAVAVYASSGLLYYGHADYLGSVRLGTTPSRTVYFDLAYGPFGETYASSGSVDPAFTGQRQDTTGGVYDFLAREYGIQGRWSSPDPAGLGVVSLELPQSFNRYAYVLNNPLALTDPTGLLPTYLEPPPCGIMGCVSCSVDGIHMPCSLAMQGLLGGAVCYYNCQNNDVAIGNTWYRYVEVHKRVFDSAVVCTGIGDGTQNCTVQMFLDVTYGWKLVPVEGALPISVAQMLHTSGQLSQTGVNYALAITGVEAAALAGAVAGPPVVAAAGRVLTTAGQTVGASAETYLPGGMATLNQVPDFIRGVRNPATAPWTPGGAAGAGLRTVYEVVKSWW